MIAAELRGGNKPSLNEALGRIGSRVDDLYGANVGRLEDVWIDPGTGVPRWLLVKEGRFGGRTTLIPFEDATAGAGHVWVPYEREVVRGAPEIEPGAPLTQQVEQALRSHYESNGPAPLASAERAASPQRDPGPAPEHPPVRISGSISGSSPPGEHDAGRGGEPERYREPLREAPPAQPAYEAYDHRQAQEPSRVPIRPASAAPIPPPAPGPYGGAPEQPHFTSRRPLPPPPAPPAPPAQQPPAAGWQAIQQPREAAPRPAPQPQHPPFGAPPEPHPSAYGVAHQPPPGDPVEMLNALAASPQSYYVEIELAGELSIRGELRSVRVITREPDGWPRD